MDHYGKDTYYPLLSDFRLPEHERLVFIIIDGLGMSFLETHGKGSTLHSLVKSQLTSVFPTTTSSALTSLMTGVAPLQHALTGWFMYFKELAAAGTPLAFTPRFTDFTFNQLGVKVDEILNIDTIVKNIYKSLLLVFPKVFIDSAFSNYCFGDKPKIGYETADECFSLIKYNLQKPTHPNMIYAYMHHFDNVAHACGINSYESIAFFRKIDNLFTDLIEQSKGQDTLFVVVSDHGLIDIPKEKRLDLNNYPDISKCLVLPLSCEARVPFCYVRPSLEKQFIKAVDDQLGECCDRYTAQELLDMSIFGLGEPNPKFFDRIGDHILLMKDNYVLQDKVYHEQDRPLIGYHGGLTREEMLVPLVVYSV